MSVLILRGCLDHLIIYEFKVYRKKTITIITSVFKDFLHRAHSICHEKYIKKEEKLLIYMFVENDHNKQLSKKLVIQYSNKNNNKSTNTTNTHNHKNNTKNRNYANLKKLP